MVVISCRSSGAPIKPTWEQHSFTWGDKTEHILSTSVNDTKLGGTAAAASSGAGNHEELRRLGQWAKRNLIKFSKGKSMSCTRTSTGIC